VLVDVGLSNAVPRLFAKPCNPSCHHWDGLTPTAGAPPEGVASMATFSSKLSRDTRSATRISSVSEELQNGKALEFGPSHALTRVPASTHNPDGTCVMTPFPIEKDCSGGTELVEQLVTCSMTPGRAPGLLGTATHRPEPSVSARAPPLDGDTGKALRHGDVYRPAPSVTPISPMPIVVERQKVEFQRGWASPTS
jgi:hypothetical protein